MPQGKGNFISELLVEVGKTVTCEKGTPESGGAVFEGEEEDGGVLDIAVLLGMPMVLIALEAVIVARGCKRPLSPTVVTATVSSPSPLSETT